MPLVEIKQVNDTIAYAIWDMTEKIEELTHLLDSINHEKVDFTGKHPKRKLEFITTRLLIKELCNHFKLPYEGVYKDEYGKPHLKLKNGYISISHSFPVAVGIINLNSPAGIDIELPQDKINRIKHKFLNDSELKYEDNLIDISLVWSAKETLYKIHGRKSVDFRKHLFVQLSEERDEIISSIRIDDQEDYRLKIGRFGDHYFTFNCD